MKQHRDSDTTLVLGAVEEATLILSEHIEPGPRDASKTLERLLAVLDTSRLATAVERLKQGQAATSSSASMPPR